MLGLWVLEAPQKKMSKNEVFSLWQAGPLQKELSPQRIALADPDSQELKREGTKAKDTIKNKRVYNCQNEINFFQGWKRKAYTCS